MSNLLTSIFIFLGLSVAKHQRLPRTPCGAEGIKKMRTHRSLSRRDLFYAGVVIDRRSPLPRGVVKGGRKYTRTDKHILIERDVNSIRERSKYFPAETYKTERGKAFFEATGRLNSS